MVVGPWLSAKVDKGRLDTRRTVQSSMKVEPIRPAATVIIVRASADSGDADFEIFMVRRTSQAAFAGGMYVFPGGRVDPDDHLHRYDPLRQGPSTDQAAQRDALGAEWRGYWIAGIRESFEEAGLLLAYTSEGSLLAYDDVNRVRFEAYRRPLHAGEVSLVEICEQEGLKLAVDHIHFVNRFITPPGRARRFDTRFFLAEAPPGQTGAHDAKETVDSTWISPREALAKNDAGDFDLMRVTRMQLEMLSRQESHSNLLRWARSNRTFPIYRPVVPRD
jgi:8-oxo-dGTP pyrophosphatase MutT (NUDIX family)